MDSLIIKCGGYQKPESIHNRAARFFGEALQQRLDGRIRFELQGNVLDLGRRSGDLPRMVESGELSCCYISTVRFTKAVPELRLFELPFVIRDRTFIGNVLDGDLGDLLKRRMNENTPFRLLGLWDNGFRHFSNSVRPIRIPADCRGLRIRTQMSELHGEVFRALGFEPIPADIKEFVEQIASGRFQAQDNPLTNIYNFGVHKHHHYITLSAHFFGATAFICSGALYRDWPADVQAAVEEAAREATLLQRRLAAEEDARILEKLDPQKNEIIRLTDAERNAFIDAVQPVLDKYTKELDPKLFAYLGEA